MAAAPFSSEAHEHLHEPTTGRRNDVAPGIIETDDSIYVIPNHNDFAEFKTSKNTRQRVQSGYY